MKTIPEEIAELNNLEEINLTGNNFVSIDEKACEKICKIRDWIWDKLDDQDMKVVQEISVLIT